MARGPWRRDPLTGLPLGKLEQVDEQYLDDDGTLNVDLFPDCDVFNVSSASAVAFGAQVNVAKSRDSMLNDPRFHFYPITDPEGRLISLATNCVSAGYVGEICRSENEERRRANLLRRGRARDVGASSTLPDDVDVTAIDDGEAGNTAFPAGSFSIVPGTAHLP